MKSKNFSAEIGRKLQILSDDGDRRVGNGILCKNLNDSDKQSFRSIVVTLD